MFILLPNSSIFENLCKAATRINPSSVSQLKFSKISVASSFLATNEHARKGIEQTYIPLVCRCVKVINFQLYHYLPALHLYPILHLPFYRFFAILLKWSGCFCLISFVAIIIYSVFSLTRPASIQIYYNKRKRLHKKRVQLPQDWFGTQTWPPFHCFWTQIWPSWRHVKTHNRVGVGGRLRGFGEVPVVLSCSYSYEGKLCVTQ